MADTPKAFTSRHFILQARTCAFLERPTIRYYEHVVVSIMQFDDSRVLNARAKALDGGLYPLGERLDVALEFLLFGKIQIPVVGQTDGFGDQGHSHAGATTRISPAFAQRLRRARRARTNWPKPIDSIARRFVTIRVIRVSNPSDRDQLQRRAQREFIRASRWSGAFRFQEQNS